MDNSSIGVFYYCYYHIFTVKHTNYHHVIIKIDPNDLPVLNNVNADSYSYCLISAVPIRLSQEEQGTLIIRGLIMDGESLLKRLKAQQKKSISTENPE